MIRFFRSIRHGLINEGKTSKYFRYAIGEIVLVVFGILIALQVNNWNIERAEAKLEQEYLQRILVEIERDVEGIHKNKAEAEYWKEMIQLLMDAYFNTEVALARPVEFVTAIKYADYILRAMIGGDVYDELRSAGHLRLIKDTAIKSALREYYRYYERSQRNDMLEQLRIFKYTELSNKVLGWQHGKAGVGFVSPERVNKLDGVAVDEALVLAALDRMRENSEYVSWLQEMYEIRARESRIYDNYIQRADALLDAIESSEKGSR